MSDTREKKYIIDNPTLMAEWDWEKNNELGLNPYSLTEGSGVKAWWKCSNGHSTYAVIRSRTNGYGCIICSGKCVISGANDLLTTFPELAQDWDFQKNDTLLPSMVAKGSDKKVWWKCNKCKQSYLASINKHTQGQGCPVCAGKKIVKGINDFPTKYPVLLKEWHPYKNININPYNFSVKSSKKVWWLCPICGYEWQAPISSRTAGYGCSRCGTTKSVERRKKLIIEQNGSLQIKNPTLSNEWDYDANYPLKPSDVSPNSHQQAWWICAKCGNKWFAQIKSRNYGTGCPVCALEKKKTIKKQPVEKSKRKVVKGKNRQTSFPEQAIYFYIKQKYTDTYNRYLEIFNNGMELDIYIPSKKIGIEYDGIAWHSSDKTHEREKIKYEICRTLGIKLIRIKESNEYKGNINDVCDILLYTQNSLNETIKQLIPFIDITSNIDVKRDEIKIKEQYLTELKKNSLAARFPELLKQWHETKNGNLKPEFFSIHSSQKIWWKCDKGHVWQSEISSRVSGNGCPYCSGRIAETGMNDFATLYPALALEWCYEENGDLNPYTLKSGSNKLVFWQCSKCAHKWKARVEQRVKGKNCPQCGNKD